MSIIFCKHHNQSDLRARLNPGSSVEAITKGILHSAFLVETEERNMRES
ncbi:MAG: hypothetical protein ACRDT3_05190 [Glutamicibacter sp.]